MLANDGGVEAKIDKAISDLSSKEKLKRYLAVVSMRGYAKSKKVAPTLKLKMLEPLLKALGDVDADVGEGAADALVVVIKQTSGTLEIIDRLIAALDDKDKQKGAYLVLKELSGPIYSSVPTVKDMNEVCEEITNGLLALLVGNKQDYSKQAAVKILANIIPNLKTKELKIKVANAFITLSDTVNPIIKKAILKGLEELCFNDDFPRKLERRIYEIRIKLEKNPH